MFLSCSGTRGRALLETSFPEGELPRHLVGCGGATRAERPDGVGDAQGSLHAVGQARMRLRELGVGQVGQAPASLALAEADQVANDLVAGPLRDTLSDQVLHQ